MVQCRGVCFVVFFFSSRRRHTRWPRDWSSDVCSSDLAVKTFETVKEEAGDDAPEEFAEETGLDYSEKEDGNYSLRSEERRVGKECRSRGWPEPDKKKKKGVEEGSRIRDRVTRKRTDSG